MLSRRLLVPFFSLISLFLFVGCAKNISSSSYAENDVGTVKQTYRGTILNVRRVKVEGADKLEENSTGLMGGGIAGAVIGSQFGKGNGQTIGTLLGAAAGALGGAYAEKKLKEQEGIEYVVELRSGRVMTVVQGPEPELKAGQAVLVMVGSKGRSRVVLDQTGGASYVAEAKRISAGSQTGFSGVDGEGQDQYARDSIERQSKKTTVLYQSR